MREGGKINYKMETLKLFLGMYHTHMAQWSGACGIGKMKNKILLCAVQMRCNCKVAPPRS